MKKLLFICFSVLFIFASADRYIRVGEQHLLQSDLQSDTFQMVVNKGWNLVSLPMSVPDGWVSTLFPNAISPAYRYDS